MRRIILPILIGSIFAVHVFGANLTVRVKDSGGNPISGAVAAAVAFPQSGGGGEGGPTAGKSGVAASDATGTATFPIESGFDYMVFVSKQGMSPTVKDQMFNPSFAPIRTTGNDIVVDRFLNNDATLAASAGQIQVNVTGVSTGTVAFGEVRNTASDMPVAFAVAKAAGVASPVNLSFSILNVPVAAAGSYRLFLGIPENQWGYAVELTSAVVNAQALTVMVSSGVFSTAERVERQDQPTGNVSFEGVVVGEGSMSPLKDCVVVLKKKNPPQDSSRWEWDESIEIAEVRTDFGGYFAFYDVPVDSYAVQVSMKGYEGRFITGAYGWGEGLRPDRPEDRWISDGTNKKIVLPSAQGKLKGYVKVYPGIPVPGAQINVWSDWSEWPRVPFNVATSSGAGYDNYYTTGMARAARGNAYAMTRADGYFELGGLAHGNYIMQVWSDLVPMSGPYLFNNGNNQSEDKDPVLTWQHRVDGDDLRLTVSSTGWVSNVYRADGTVKNNDLWTAPLTVYIGTHTAQPGTITGTITFDSEFDAVTVSSVNPITLWAQQQDAFGGDQKRFYTTISGTLGGKTTEYVINVATATKYWIEIHSRDWGVVGRLDMNADLSSKGSLTGFDFRLVRAGRIKGLVRLPDGRIFKRRQSQGAEDRIDLIATGNNINSRGWGYIADDGYFEIAGLAPGNYSLTTRNEHVEYGEGRETRAPLEWPNVTVDGILVRQGAETYVEVQLKPGARVMPKTPSLPPIPAPPPPFTQPYARYAILQFPSSTGAMRDVLVTLLGGPEDYERNVAFGYDATKTDPWSSRRILPGRYDFVLSRVDLFKDGSENDGTQPSDHYSITIISQLKNVEINYDPLKSDTTTFLEFESGTLGQSVLRGKVEGAGIFAQGDVDIITKSGMTKFLSYIPSVMLYDAAGQLKAFSMALPRPDRLPEWKNRIDANSFTFDWFKTELSAYPVQYKIDRLPAGHYVAVFETPNYPPMMRKVTLTSGDNVMDVNFDSNVIVGSSISGLVRSTDSVPISGATVMLTHRTVTKTIVSDNLGRFQVSGLPPGVYRMTVTRPGYAPAAHKFGLGRDVKRFTGDDALVLTKANASVEGTVFSQKMPTPKVIVGAKIVAYNETYNTQNPGKMLPVISAKTDEQGRYYLDGIRADNIYKIYVLAPGKLLEWKLMGTTKNPLAQGANAGIDFVLKSLPPRLKITMAKIYENGRFLYKFLIESPKKIINPSNPSALAAPYCRYSPVANASAAFDVASAVEVLPNVGPEIANPDGGKIYSYSLKIPVIEDNEYYKLRVEATDGSSDYSEDILFGPRIEAKAKKDLKEELAEGGDISLDDTGYDTTQITVDPGSLTPTGATTSNITENDVDVPIGGFLSAMPNFNLSKTGSAKSAAMARIIDTIVASDVYEVDLKDAQMNKSLSLNLRFDLAKVTDADLANLAICQYNSSYDRWERIPGPVTVDPISSVVSIDIDSVEQASGGTARSPSAGRAAIKNGMFVVNRAAATSQSGVFAVFKQDPATAIAYAGSEFAVYNFPNPFDLKTKTVTLTDVASDATQSIQGTMIKYALPPSKSGRLRFYVYNLAGELVRDMDLGSMNGGYYYYAEWDGKNDNGDECASGIYFLIAKLDGKKLNAKPLKIAILK